MRLEAAFALLLLPACTEYDIIPEDPNAPAVEADMPVAVCDVSPNPVTPPYQDAVFDGSGSYDPDDREIVSYAWELVQTPSGSAVNMPGGDAIRSLTPDVAGDYVARLTVTNDQEKSNSCEITLTAVPSQDLWVEMYWQTPGDDMDLHLLAPGGTLETDTDCYFMNCKAGSWDTPDWGQMGYEGDDPVLDLDDISGTGSENINIDDPAPGTYEVIVHDYPGSVYDPNNAVTVTIYLGGSPAWSDTFTISGEDTYTSFATIEWPSGDITPQ